MAILEQKNSGVSTYIGWYGTCPDEAGQESDCASFPLITGDPANPFSWRHVVDPEQDVDQFNVGASKTIKAIYEVSANGQTYASYDGTVTSVFGLPNLTVKSLECGRSYVIILNPTEGGGTLDIPEFTFANQGTSSYKKLVLNT